MINLNNYGFTEKYGTEATAKEGIPARITAEHRGRFDIICSLGSSSAVLKSKEYYTGDQLFPTTGDFVMVDFSPDGDSRIRETLPRATFFSRSDNFHRSSNSGEQIVAANFDYVFCVASLNKDFNIKKLERYATLAWQSGATPVIVLTKADSCDNVDSFVTRAEEIAPGVNVLAVSSKSGYGMEGLEQYLEQGKTIALLGASGVGKSSLVNAIAGEEIMSTGEIREDDSRGRHTTTHRQLVLIEKGTHRGVIFIDTPGMRELGMFDVTEGLGQSFPEIDELTNKCRFSDCTHGNEPGCAVRQAIENGEISVDRWQTYLQLKNEAKFSDDKGAYIKERTKFRKQINKDLRNKKKLLGR